MDTAVFTESEVDFILDKLFKYAMFDEDVATVCRLLVIHFPKKIVHSKLRKVIKKTKVGEGSDKK